jgi:hypothetical protein
VQKSSVPSSTFTRQRRHNAGMRAWRTCACWCAIRGPPSVHPQLLAARRRQRRTSSRESPIVAKPSACRHVAIPAAPIAFLAAPVAAPVVAPFAALIAAILVVFLVAPVVIPAAPVAALIALAAPVAARLLDRAHRRTPRESIDALQDALQASPHRRAPQEPRTSTGPKGVDRRASRPTWTRSKGDPHRGTRRESIDALQSSPHRRPKSLVHRRGPNQRASRSSLQVPRETHIDAPQDCRHRQSPRKITSTARFGSRF